MDLSVFAYKYRVIGGFYASIVKNRDRFSFVFYTLSVLSYFQDLAFAGSLLAIFFSIKIKEKFPFWIFLYLIFFYSILKIERKSISYFIFSIGNLELGKPKRQTNLELNLKNRK